MTGEVDPFGEGRKDLKGEPGLEDTSYDLATLSEPELDNLRRVSLPPLTLALGRKGGDNCLVGEPGLERGRTRA